MARVAQMPCMVCGSWPVTLHHPRGHEFGTGAGVRASHFDVIPLCHNHHQGKEGFHTIGKKTWEKKYGTQWELLQKLKNALTS